MSVWGAGLTISKYKNGPASRGITTTHPQGAHSVTTANRPKHEIIKCRQQPTLPHPPECSTISATQA